MNETYAKAYVEVLELLKCLPKNEYAKISIEKIQFYEENKDKNYETIGNERFRTRRYKERCGCCF